MKSIVPRVASEEERMAQEHFGDWTAPDVMAEPGSKAEGRSRFALSIGFGRGGDRHLCLCGRGMAFSHADERRYRRRISAYPQCNSSVPFFAGCRRSIAAISNWCVGRCARKAVLEADVRRASESIEPRRVMPGLFAVAGAFSSDRRRSRLSVFGPAVTISENATR